MDSVSQNPKMYLRAWINGKYIEEAVTEYNKVGFGVEPGSSYQSDDIAAILYSGTTESGVEFEQKFLYNSLELESFYPSM